MLYVRPGSSAIPGGMQNSVIGITQALDSVMRQETQGGSDNASGAGPSGGRGLANADGGPQGGGSVVTAGSDESGQTVQTGGLGAPGFIGEMTLDSNGTLSVTPSDVTAQLDGNAPSDGASDEDDDEADDDTSDEDEDEEAQEEAGEEERSDE